MFTTPLTFASLHLEHRFFVGWPLADVSSRLFATDAATGVSSRYFCSDHCSRDSSYVKVAPGSCQEKRAASIELAARPPTKYKRFSFLALCSFPATPTNLFWRFSRWYFLWSCLLPMLQLMCCNIVFARDHCFRTRPACSRGPSCFRYVEVAPRSAKRSGLHQ